MKHHFDSVLNQCLDMLAQGLDIEACLQRFPQEADQLRPLLEAAAAVRRVSLPEPFPQALAAGERALLAALAQSERGQRRWGIGKPLATLGVAATLAGLALLGLALAGPLRDAFNLDADAAVADGTVTSVADGSLVVETAKGTSTVVVNEKTEVELEDGSPADITIITPGTEIRIRGRQEGEDLIQAQRIEVRVEVEPPAQGLQELEFQGQVVAISNGTLTVSTPAGNVIVNLTLDTEVGGQLQVGATIKVHGSQGADGTISAREVDVLLAGGAGLDEDEDEIKEEDGDNSGPGSASDGADDSGPGSPGSGRDPGGD